MGPETADDAGAVLIGDGVAMIQTVDFFPPVVDDPADYGRIVAANSLSDVYAMGAKPLAVMNVVGWPGKMLGMDILAAVLKGSGEKVTEAGAILLGGHTMDNSQVLFGLSVTGLLDPARIVRNNTARPGEVLVLTKPLGSGILTTAAKGKALGSELLERLVQVMCRLNDKASETMVAMEAGAGTDVTGFGLMGHLYEVASGSSVTFEVDAAAVPYLEEARHFAAQGFFPGGSAKNRTYVEDHFEVAGQVDDLMLKVLFDAQTSGGLLFTVAPEKTDETLSRLHDGGDTRARAIGRSLPFDGIHIRIR